MKQFILFICGIFFCFLTVEAQVITFEKTIGTLSGDYGSDIIQDIRGNYFFAGTIPFNSWDGAICLAKVGEYGDTLWTNNYYDYDGRVLHQTKDRGFILIGEIGVWGRVAIALIKTDSNGVVQWQQSFMGNDGASAYDLEQTSDGGYVMAGWQNIFPIGGSPYVIKTDTSGNKLWHKGYGVINDDNIYAIRETNDGGFIITGDKKISGSNSDLWLIKIDSNGNEMWEKNFGSANYESGRSLQITSDNGFIIAGTTYSSGSGGNDIYLIKTDRFGNYLWSKTYGGTSDEGIKKIEITNDRGYAILGSTKSFGNGMGDFFFIRTDSSGNTLWTRTFGGISNDYSFSLKQTTDKGFILIGATQSFGLGSSDVYLIKTDSNGCLIPNVDFSADTTFLNVGDTIYFSDLSSQVGITDTIKQWLWNFGDGTTDTVQNPSYSYSFADTFTVTLTVTNKFGCSNPLTKNNYIIVNSSTGVEEKNKINFISISPNPFSTSAIISINEEIINKTCHLELYDLVGKKVKQVEVKGNKAEIHRDNLPQGMYFYKITDEKGILATGKIVIQ